jgi:hypothetical protein
VVLELHREALALPWNLQFTEKEGKTRVIIGLPEECKPTASERFRTLSECPEASEREAGCSPGGAAR